MGQLKAAVLAAARDIMAGDLARGLIDLHYRRCPRMKRGTVAYTLPFKHAVNIIPE